ncbi:MAG: rhodanese-like domain-containing protein, partial [Gammaproteobacteria bacterium]
FGEEALISGGERNATVTMETPGVVMRLAKSDFDELLKEPLIDWVSPEEARQLVAEGAYWLDVRHAREYQHQRLPSAINIPLHELRSRIGELDKTRRYVCYCKTGRRSSAAAFLLTQNGFKASVLRGGLQVLPHRQEKKGA